MNKSIRWVGGLALALTIVFAASVVRGGVPGRIIDNFDAASNAQTPIGVTDGNPLAATAVFANSMYRQLGFNLALGVRFHGGHFEAAIESFGDFGDRYSGLGARATLSFRW